MIPVGSWICESGWMRKGIEVRLGPGDRERLEAVIGSGNSPQKHVWRARIVLLSADGVGTMAIQRQTGKGKPTIWRCQARFMAEGVDGLLHGATRPGGKPPLTLSSVLRFSLKMGFENSLVGISPTIQPGRAPAEWLSRDRCHPPLGGGGADGPTWRTDDDPGIASTGAVGHGDRAADGPRSKDRAQICRARHRGAGLRAALGGPPQQARPIHGIFA